MTLHILIPCKSLGDGKTRLAQALDAKARRDLCTGFLQRTLDVALALVPPSRCHVMAGDGAAAAIAAARGVASCDDPEIGLNEALRQGRNALPQRCGRVRAADLPHRSAMGDGGRARRPGTLRRRRGHCAGPGADGDESHSILVRGRRDGSSSSSAPTASPHTRARRVLVLRVDVYEDARLSFDVDHPEDYLEWQRGEGPGATKCPRAEPIRLKDVGGCKRKF